MKRWSKLQSKLYSIMIKDFQIHVAKYSLNGLNAYGKHTNLLPRYWITVGKDIIFDYPKMFPNANYYPWSSDMSDISNIIEEYINCSVDELLTFYIDNPYSIILEFLKACDKRIGKRRLNELKLYLKNEIAISIIDKRLSGVYS